MKKLAIILCFMLIISLLPGCSAQPQAQIAATTLPVYEFTTRLCEGTEISVTRLVTEEVSCLHDYTLKTAQMRAIEGAQLVIISGGGLEDFMADIVPAHKTIDASSDIELHCGHEHEGHSHEHDPHIWLSPLHAKDMVSNIAAGLCKKFPQHTDTFRINEGILHKELDSLYHYGQEQLANLSCRELVTFHDGFHYFAECFDLEILHAVEEESGSEASAQELIELINLVEESNLPAIFTERSGSTSAANIVAKECGIKIYTLDMAMAGNSYYDAMHANIHAIKEALE